LASRKSSAPCEADFVHGRDRDQLPIGQTLDAASALARISPVELKLDLACQASGHRS